MFQCVARDMTYDYHCSVEPPLFALNVINAEIPLLVNIMMNNNF